MRLALAPIVIKSTIYRIILLAIIDTIGYSRLVDKVDIVYFKVGFKILSTTREYIEYYFIANR